MEEIKSNTVLKFNVNQLSDVRKALGYEDVNKLKQDIEQLDDWIQKQNHFRVRKFDRGFLERLLIYNKGSIERAKQRLDKLFPPEQFTRFSIHQIRNSPDSRFTRFVTDQKNVCILPKPTKDNYRIMLTHAIGNDDKDFNMIQYYRYVLALGHYMLNNDYCHGYESVGDTRNITFSNVGSINPIVVHKGLTLMTDAMGHRLKKIHLISGSKLFDTVVVLLKQGLSGKVKERIIVHQNLESLHEHLPKELLPIELGGVEGSIKEINDENFKQLCMDSNIEKVKYMEKATTDESLRLVSKFNEDYSGMPGSFKTLCVD